MASKRNPKPRKNAARSARRARRVEARNNMFTHAVTHHGDGSRTIELTEAGSDAMREHLEWARGEFVRVWGREMGPHDPVFPDWDSPVPAPMTAAKMEAQMVDAMQKAGWDPAHIYAYQQSGILLTAGNEELADPDDVAEWYAAIARWRALHG